MEGGRALGPLREVPRGGRTHAHARPPGRQGAQGVTLVGLALAGAVKARARELGFDRVAVGPAGPPEHGPAFERWLAAGHAGTMDYLAHGRQDRLDPDRLLPGCRSVVAVRSEEHTSELQSHSDLVCRLLLEKKNTLRKRFLRISKKACSPATR